jgi:hypothetical protein
MVRVMDDRYTMIDDEDFDAAVEDMRVFSKRTRTHRRE